MSPPFAAFNTLNYQATPIPLGAAQVRWAAIEQSRHGCRRSRAEEWIPSWRRFAKMANQKRRSVFRRGASSGFQRARDEHRPLALVWSKQLHDFPQTQFAHRRSLFSRSVSTKAHDFRKRQLASRSQPASSSAKMFRATKRPNHLALKG